MGVNYVSSVVAVTRTREEALEAARNLTDDFVIEVLRDTVLDPMYEEDFYSWGEDGIEPTGVVWDRMYPRLEECIHTVYDALDGLLRTASYAIIDGCKFAVTGGESWGDSPECFDDFVIADMIGVTRDPAKYLFWSDLPQSK